MITASLFGVTFIAFSEVEFKILVEVGSANQISFLERDAIKKLLLLDELSGPALILDSNQTRITRVEGDLIFYLLSTR